MYKTILILLASLCTCNAYAKQSSIQFEPDTTIKTYSSFNKVHFLDLRKQKEYVGSLRSGVKKSGFVPAYSFDSMMCNFVRKLIEPTPIKEDQTLVIAFHSIDLEEKYNGSYPVGNLYLRVDFYLGKNNQHVKVFGIDSLFEFQIGDWEVKDLAKVYDRIFTNILIGIAETRLTEERSMYTLQEIMVYDSLQRSKYPVYYQQPQSGIYYTLEQFLKNEPADTAFVQQHINNGADIFDKFYLKEEGGKRGRNLADTCFAIYNGKKWFAPCNDKDFREMVNKNGNFYYTAKAPGLVQASAGAYSLMFGGGILGYAIADAVTDGINKRNPDKKRELPFRFKVNPELKKAVRIERLE